MQEEVTTAKFVITINHLPVFILSLLSSILSVLVHAEMSLEPQFPADGSVFPSELEMLLDKDKLSQVLNC